MKGDGANLVEAALKMGYKKSINPLGQVTAERDGKEVDLGLVEIVCRKGPGKVRKCFAVMAEVPDDFPDPTTYLPESLVAELETWYSEDKAAGKITGLAGQDPRPLELNIDTLGSGGGATGGKKKSK